ncbi:MULTISPECIES: aromatic ring-hydroxylating dioxygenase subunit alpha [unclassified Caballeronia]|jgi:phenylpropionate dioxygenase-like ring-hydroxylating dioxygenase large terminal subunit|uniref:aromatic ring-hydroxylating dioxygenase subunit alpha n=1 Tax=unclassified Caballeronia TaxID=2646786 RepID=UPI003ECCCD5D
MQAIDDTVARDDWYVVSFGKEIAPGRSERTRLLGQDIIVSRDHDNTVHCSFVRESGEQVPLPDVREQYGFIWVTPGKPRRDILAIPEFAEPGRRFIYRGRIGVPTSGQRVIENFFDLSHFSFIHTGTLGGYESAEVPRYSVEMREEGAELWAVGCSFFQPMASAAAGGGSTIFYDYRIASPFIALIYKDSLIQVGKKDVIGLFIQPVEEDRCIVHSFACVHDSGNSDTGILHFYHEIFAQDRMVLINQFPRKLPVNPRRELPMRSDASSMAYRRWLDRSGLEFGIERAL